MREEGRDGREDRLDQVPGHIIGAAIEVHKTQGLGLLESAYEACLAVEVRRLGYKIEQQKAARLFIKTRN
jgi:GxxExxY protein